MADSTSDESNSHGWIFYKIKPKNTTVVGDAFDATASIYFDFNPAVVTNTYTTTIVSPSTYVPDDNFENYLETHDANANVVTVGDPTSIRLKGNSSLLLATKYCLISGPILSSQYRICPTIGKLWLIVCFFWKTSRIAIITKTIIIQSHQEIEDRKLRMVFIFQ